MRIPDEIGKCQAPFERTEFHTAPVWTCADKSRVLLTDESGKKHCVKF